VGAVCSDCKAKKYRCSQRGKNDAEIMWVTRPAVQMGTEIKVLSDLKGKKRKAELPVPVERKVKVEKPKRSRVKAENKASGSKQPAKQW